jgi:hypothetical protein
VVHLPPVLFLAGARSGNHAIVESGFLRIFMREKLCGGAAGTALVVGGLGQGCLGVLAACLGG